MAGFDNDVLYGVNADYSNALSGTGASTTGQLLTNGQLWIGSTATNAGGTHINVGTLTSPGGTVTIGYSSPNITLDIEGGLVAVETLSDDAGTLTFPSPSNNIQLVGHVFQGNGVTHIPTTVSGTNLINVNPMSASRWIVDSKGFNGTHTTISSALTSASSGDTIFVLAGTYTENLTLKAGVNLVAYTGDDQTQNVIIVGKLTATFAGGCTIGNIGLQTNSDFLLEVSGSSATVVTLNNCFLNCTNNTGISHTSSSASSAITLNNCLGNIGTTGITLFSSSSPGPLFGRFTTIGNSGGSTTASTKSAGVLNCADTSFVFPVTTSGTATIIGFLFRIIPDLLNVTALTVGGSGQSTISKSAFASGTASCISISSNLMLDDVLVSTSNTNAITGAGTLSYNGLSFINTSNINVTTQTILLEGPSRTIGSANSGNTNTLTVTNSSNTASSNALSLITVGGTSAGDPFTTYTVSGTTNWSQGIDNSVTGDPFVISASNALGTTNIMSAATTGEINYPLQPAFLATSNLQSNVTGNNVVYTIIYANEIYDQNSDYNNATGVFTAPVTGRYHFTATVVLSDLGVANTVGTVFLVGSNRSITLSQSNYGVQREANNLLGISGASYLDMDAADTCSVAVQVFFGTQIIDVVAACAFGGSLIC